MLADRVRMGSKTKGSSSMPFVVGDVIPSTTQLKVSWDVRPEDYYMLDFIEILTDSDNFAFLYDPAGGIIVFYTGQQILKWGQWMKVCGINGDNYCGMNGDENDEIYGVAQFIILDTTSLTEAQRTISTVYYSYGDVGLMYEEV